jgi:hypothetical protein
MYWLATRSGIDAHLEIIPGAHHTFRVWRDAFAAALPWLSARLTPVVYPPPARLLGPPVTWRYVRHVRTREDQDSAPLAAGLPLHENPLGRSRG